MNSNTEPALNPTTQKQVIEYLEGCDPLVMMTLLMDFGRTHRHTLTDEQYRQIGGCHNMLAALYRNE